MQRWLKRIRAAFMMGLTWAIAWAPLGLLLGTIVDPDGAMEEPWLLVGIYPGFVGGVAFATVLGVLGRRRRFAELSVPRLAAWGAAAGLLVGTLCLVVAVVSDPPQWLLYGVAIGSLTLLSSASAAGSLAIARRAERLELTAGATTGGHDLPAGGTGAAQRSALIAERR